VEGLKLHPGSEERLERPASLSQAQQRANAFDDPCCYPGTTVLKNLLGIQNQDTLDAFEVEISTLRAEEPLPDGDFDNREPLGRRTRKVAGLNPINVAGTAAGLGPLNCAPEISAAYYRTT
jgi:hypothetical protein